MATGKSIFSVFDPLEKYGDQYLLEKAPAIPDNIREILAFLTPWFIIISIIMTVPLFFSFLGLTTPFGSYYMGYSYSFVNVVYVLTLVVSVVLQAMAVPGLLKRSISGWRMLFYANLVSVVSAVMSLNPLISLIALLIGFYLLFQIKPLYR